MDTERVLGHERQRRVLRHLKSQGVAHVQDLADAVGVSTSTIRRDLKELGDQGLLNRVHGGAILLGDDLEVAPVNRQGEQAAQKRRIGEAAAATVRDHSTILITGGTTTEAMLPFLQGRAGLTVLTNGLNVALQLSRYPRITVVVLGGILRHAEMSLLGPLAEHAMDEFEAEVAFSGTYGIDPVIGLTGASVHEATTDRRLLRRTPRLTVLADSAKFSRRGPVRMASVDQIDRLITDIDAPDAAVRDLITAGVSVQRV